MASKKTAQKITASDSFPTDSSLDSHTPKLKSSHSHVQLNSPPKSPNTDVDHTSDTDDPLSPLYVGNTDKPPLPPKIHKNESTFNIRYIITRD